MFSAGINLLSPGEICMMSHFHSFVTIIKGKTKKQQQKENWICFD